MKHLLIILISILLLSSPLFGQSKETSVLYKWKSGSRWVWKSFGVDGIHTKYMGEIKNGKPDGRVLNLYLMEESILLSGRMGNKMVKGNGLYLMDISM